MTAAADLSVVVAVRDEGPTVLELAERLDRVAHRRGWDLQLIIVDDGSITRTHHEALGRLRLLHPLSQVIFLDRRHGQMAALALGMHQATGVLIATMDGDLQDRPEDLPRLVDSLGKNAFAVTTRDLIHEQAARRVGSKFMTLLAGVLTGVRLQDYGGQYNVYRAELVESMIRRWRPGAALLPLACTLDPYPAVARVHRDPRRSGRTKYQPVTLGLVAVQLVVHFSSRRQLTTLAAFGLAAVAGTAVASRSGPPATHLSLVRAVRRLGLASAFLPMAVALRRRTMPIGVAALPRTT